MHSSVHRSFHTSEYQYNSNNPPWQKLLWVKQNYPDNYVDGTFLDELQRNVNVRTYDYWTMVYESGVITQHIFSVVIFIAIFIYLRQYTITGNYLIWLGSIMTGLGYLFWDLMMSKTRENYEFKCLSPILKTLTSQISDDTIWALTVCCFLANILFHDYQSKTSNNIKISGSLSTNAAVFASVLLASRLNTNLDVFGLLSFAVEWFSLFPIFRRHLKELSPRIQVSITVIMLLCSVLLFIHISKAVVFISILGFCFLTFVCPYWLIFIQKYKNEIHGPWDEARPGIQRSKRSIYRK
ncbi:phosphatidylinositol N-acetylglucosaminyltransferase subunit C [Pilobolus umbonatus]|nr:phosphatidylinositol N-acetylglucosaminyltransferase subunit C [Pilobolus umbonatus]